MWRRRRCARHLLIELDRKRVDAAIGAIGLCVASHPRAAFQRAHIQHLVLCGVVDTAGFMAPEIEPELRAVGDHRACGRTDTEIGIVVIPGGQAVALDTDRLETRPEGHHIATERIRRHLCRCRTGCQSPGQGACPCGQDRFVHPHLPFALKLPATGRPAPVPSTGSTVRSVFAGACGDKTAGSCQSADAPIRLERVVEPALGPAGIDARIDGANVDPGSVLGEQRQLAARWSRPRRSHRR